MEEQQFTVKMEGLSEVVRSFMDLPGMFTRARESALSSTGYMIMSELRNHIEYGGSGWAPLHPLTLRLRKFRSAPPSPLFYLGRFARYMIDPDALSVRVHLGKGSARHGTVDNQAGTSLGFSTYMSRDDKWLAAAARRAEHGQTVPVTRGTRKLWLTTKHSKTQKGTAGKDWFVLRKTTTTLKIPPRPIFGPVFNKIQPMAVAYFEKKYWEAFARYTLKAGNKK
jgi:hypothetical protein